ncbi:MAG: hypothetical protein ACKO0Z_16680 [Betaproteobacteria bacterium]
MNRYITHYLLLAAAAIAIGFYGMGAEYDRLALAQKIIDGSSGISTTTASVLLALILAKGFTAYSFATSPATKVTGTRVALIVAGFAIASYVSVNSYITGLHAENIQRQRKEAREFAVASAQKEIEDRRRISEELVRFREEVRGSTKAASRFQALQALASAADQVDKTASAAARAQAHLAHDASSVSDAIGEDGARLFTLAGAVIMPFVGWVMFLAGGAFFFLHRQAVGAAREAHAATLLPSVAIPAILGPGVPQNGAEWNEQPQEQDRAEQAEHGARRGFWWGLFDWFTSTPAAVAGAAAAAVVPVHAGTQLEQYGAQWLPEIGTDGPVHVVASDPGVLVLTTETGIVRHHREQEPEQPRPDATAAERRAAERRAAEAPQFQQPTLPAKKTGRTYEEFALEVQRLKAVGVVINNRNVKAHLGGGSEVIARRLRQMASEGLL